MTHFNFKNLPKGFEFPFTKHEIREYVKTTTAKFEAVEFDGLSSSESFYNKSYMSKMHFVCYLKAEHKEGEWCFKLEVNGLRPERYEGRREEIAQALFSQIEKWTDKKLALSATAPKKPCRAHVSFDLKRKPEDIAKLSEWN